MERIVITGATSFIGKHMVAAALERGWEVVAVVRRRSDKRRNLPENGRLSVVELNLEEYAELGNVTGAADCFVHLAWNGTRGESRTDEKCQQENFANSIAAVKSMINAGCKCIVTAGSQAEYGRCDDMIYEDSQCNPNTAYGICKLRLYRDVMQICSEHGVAYREARFFSLYGPGDYEGTLVMSLLDAMRKDCECNLTECMQLWNFVYVDDAVEAVLQLCEKDCEDGAYNIASEDTRILKEYVEEMRRILNSNSRLRYGAIPYPPNGMVSISPSVEKIKSETGWQPKVTFREGILRMISADEKMIKDVYV